MTATSTTTEAAQQYLLEVERELADLPADERGELLEELAGHLAALEEDPDEAPWESRLGAPADYARELRAAAGLPPRATPALSWLAAASTGWARAKSWRGVQEVRAFVPQLRPGWWVLRGYLVVLLPALRGKDAVRDFPVPAPLDSHALGVLLVALAVVASVLVGRVRLPRPVAAGVLAANLALLVLAAGAADDATARLTRVRVVHGTVLDYATGQAPLVNRHGPVTNVLPYTADGRPLHDVLLYDQDGRPLLTAAQQWWSDRCLRVLDQPRAFDGAAIPFSYPQRYVLAAPPRDISGSPLPPGRTCLAAPVVPKLFVPARAVAGR
jgi:hypothetical protein